MRWRSFSFALLALIPAIAGAQAWQSDRGDGTYANPPLYADYPDPDIIRVGKIQKCPAQQFSRVVAQNALTGLAHF